MDQEIGTGLSGRTQRNETSDYPVVILEKNQSSLKDRADLGVYLDSHDEVEDIGEDAHHFPVIVINFRVLPTVSYSLARLLRDRYSYKGEIRAVGDAAGSTFLHEPV